MRFKEFLLLESRKFKFKEGDRVRYYPIGNERPKKGTITSMDTEGKRDITYGVDCDDGDERWGYADQFTLLKEGEVIHGKFEQKLRAKKGEHKNPDLEPPVSRKDKKPFDHFETVTGKSGKFATIWGTRKDGYREDLGTTDRLLAKIMADAYNAGGYTKHDVEKIDLKSLFKE